MAFVPIKEVFVGIHSKGDFVSVKGMIVQLRPVTRHLDGRLRREITLCDGTDVITIVLFDDHCYAMDPEKRLHDEREYLGVEDPILAENVIAFEDLEVTGNTCIMLQSYAKKGFNTKIHFPYEFHTREIMSHQRRLSRDYRNALLKDHWFVKLADIIDVDEQPFDVCYHTVLATVKSFRPLSPNQGFFYNGCPADTCRKGGMVQLPNGMVQCEKCQQTFHGPVLRFKVLLQLDDESLVDGPEFSCFLEISRTPLSGHSAGERNVEELFSSDKQFVFRVEMKRNTEEEINRFNIVGFRQWQ